MTEPITAKQIVSLLAEKHSKDVFVPECKDGPSWGRMGADLLVMDAWAMAKSWARPTVTAYEIKVDRQDFLRDEKWPGYLPCCNRFYFVAPTGLIHLEELSAEAGLIAVSKTGTRLFTKKKAPHREVEVPETIWRYLLMWRTEITRDRPGGSNEEYWRQWLTRKKENQDLGRAVGRRLMEIGLRKVAEVQVENRRLKSENKIYAEVKEILEELGITWTSFLVKRDLQRALQRELIDAIPADLKAKLDAVKKAIDGLYAEWDRVSEGKR